MDRKSIKVFKGHDERILVQIMQSVTGEYEIWVREKQSNLLGGNLLKHLGKHSNLAAVRATDLAAFGRPFITNPDLPERFRNNWPLNPADDMSLWYTPGTERYTNYQPYRYLLRECEQVVRLNYVPVSNLLRNAEMGGFS